MYSRCPSSRHTKAITIYVNFRPNSGMSIIRKLHYCNLFQFFITVCQIKADFLKKDLSDFTAKFYKPIKTIVHKCKATFQFKIQFAQTLRKDCLENVLNLCELTFSTVIYNQQQQQQQQHLKSTDSILSEPPPL